MVRECERRWKRKRSGWIGIGNDVKGDLSDLFT